MSIVSCRILPAALTFAAALLFASEVCAGPLEDGRDAYWRGDYARALELLRPLAEQGDGGAETTGAQTYLGFMYLNGRGVPENRTEAVRWFLRAAGSGDTEAQTAAGHAYFYGWGVGVDLNRSAEWYRRAADQGYAEAQFQLGAMYENGFGVAQDYVEALKWSILAIARFPPSEAESIRLATGNRDRQSEHLSPEQIAEAERLASEWQPTPFQRTNADALRDAALALQRNDYRAAASLYLPLAEQGVAEAQTMLGTMYGTGSGVAPDPNEAVKWFRLAAEQGDAGGQDGLGRAYEDGDGVPRDPVRAYMWYFLAAASGDPFADEFAKNRDRLAAKLTAEQIAEAQRLAEACKAADFRSCD
jgi:uncharacterized protein